MSNGPKEKIKNLKKGVTYESKEKQKHSRMSRNEKLLSRLLSLPSDFTWDELVRILSYFRYKEVMGGKTGGSRRKFVDEKKNIISLHKPHPSNIVKGYAIRDVVTHLKAIGHIKDE